MIRKQEFNAQFDKKYNNTNKHHLQRTGEIDYLVAQAYNHGNEETIIDIAENLMTDNDRKRHETVINIARKRMKTLKSRQPQSSDCKLGVDK